MGAAPPATAQAVFGWYWGPQPYSKSFATVVQNRPLLSCPGASSITDVVAPATLTGNTMYFGGGFWEFVDGGYRCTEGTGSTSHGMGIAMACPEGVLRGPAIGTCQCPAGKKWQETPAACVDTCPAGSAPDSALVCRPQGDDPGNNGGCPDGTCKVGNPINPGAGTKFERVPLYTGNGPYPLGFDLVYNSRSTTSASPPIMQAATGNFGAAWIAPHQRVVKAAMTASLAGFEVPGSTEVQRPDGKILTFNRVGGGNDYAAIIPAFADRLTRLIESGVFVGWRYTNSATDETEFYDPAGSFLYMANRQGLTQTIGYADGQGGFYYAANSPTATQPHPAAYIAPVCTPPSSGWHLAAGGTAPAGRALCMADPFGRQLNFRYDAQARVIAIADPAGHLIEFEYDGDSAERWNGPSDPAPNVVTRISGADWTVRTLHYNEADRINNGGACNGLAAEGLPRQLTGTSDGAGQRMRGWTYDCQGRATGSDKGDGTLDSSTLTHDTPGPGQVTLSEATAAGTSIRVLGFTTQNGIVRATGTSAPCIDCGPSAATTYDANGFVASRIDWNGNLTCYTHDARGRETKRVEGLGGTACPGTVKPETRTIGTDWHAEWRLPVRVVEPLRTTFYTYGAANDPNPGNRGHLLSQCTVATSDPNGAGGNPPTTCGGGASRTTTYTYTALGQLAGVDGPRTDVADLTTMTYHPATDADIGKRGNLASVTNALGHVTQVSTYNPHGQPQTLTDPNGLTTTLAYDARQRIASRSIGTETTDYTYTDKGDLAGVTLPDDSVIAYTYDGAQRLVEVADGLGNRIVYTLDVRGNRIREDVFDAANAVVQTRGRVYDALNRPTQVIGAQSQTTVLVHDANGNRTASTDPLNRTTTSAYDALNRLVAVTRPSPAAGQSAPLVAYAYNGQDRLVQVTDPRNLVTTYTIDGLANTLQQNSPDTGLDTWTYDAAGNALGATDARGKTATRVYDALNRLTSVLHNQAAGAELRSVVYGYDQGVDGKGRLTSVTETSATGALLQGVTYTYDAHGRVLARTRTPAGGAAATLAYAYDTVSGRLTGMTYPSGRTLAYTYDAIGRITRIDTTAPAAQGGQTQMLVSNVAYHPFGGVKAYLLGNNRQVTRAYDQDGRLAAFTLGGALQTLSFDNADRITALTDTANAAGNRTYAYDNLDRLIQATLPATTYTYAYDATGNRTARGAGAATSGYTISGTSNRLSQVTGSGARSFTHDAAGNIASDGANQYGYDARGRLAQVTGTAGTTAYQVDSQGLRVRKTNASPGIGDTVYHHDTEGKLIAESAPDGTTRREYFHLLDIPVGVNVR